MNRSSTNLTREEMASFKTALSLVVVKKRFEARQEEEAQRRRRLQARLTPSNTSSGKKKKRPPPPPAVVEETKRLRTMDSLVFSWQSNNDKSSAVTTTLARTTTSTTASMLEVQSKQREHLDAMMTMAIRIANNNKKNNKTALDALTNHLVQQVSFAFDVAHKMKQSTTSTSTTRKATKTKKKQKTPPAPDQWIADWARDSLRQHKNDDEDSNVDAVFCVWQSMLFGGQQTTATNRMRASCRQLFLQVFCSLLQELRIADGSLVSSQENPTSGVSTTDNKKQHTAKKMRSSLSNRSSANNRNNNKTTQRVSFKSTTTTYTISSNNRPMLAPWQRLFAVAAASQQHAHENNNEKNPWLVQGLRLVQQIVLVNTPEQHPQMHHLLHPISFLPPNDLIHWYTTKAAERLPVVPHRTYGNYPGVEPTKNGALGTGAQLMTMVALYQALKLQQAAAA